MSNKLTIKQQKFCKYYASSEESFANGVKSYAIAYNIDLSDKKQYKSAKSNAYKLLANNKILDYINELLEEANLNDGFVGKQLGFLIAQNQNLSVKRQAIADYYKLYKIIEKVEDQEEDSEHMVDGVPLSVLNEDKDFTDALSDYCDVMDNKVRKLKEKNCKY